MRITTTLTFPTGHTVDQDHYRLRLALPYWRWLLSLLWISFRAKGWGLPFMIRVKVSGTRVQRALSWVRRTARTLWDRRDPRHSVTAYSVHRYLADMIEGGRWFNAYSLEEVRYCWRRSSLDRIEEDMLAQYGRTDRRYSVLGGEDYEVWLNGRFSPVPEYIDTYVPYE
jgi:hypothetical protein